MQKANAVPRAFAWFKTAMAELKAFVNEIPPTFIRAFKSLEVVDMILVPRAFAKIAGAFGNFIGRFLSWAGGTFEFLACDVEGPDRVATPTMHILMEGARLMDEANHNKAS